ncbi:MAG TPA: putative sulfate/molybdate transporter [Burkholderiales bacterium]|nr:putative sulfate/molybdate transporter [Burkholderiales bacterium]
MPIRFDRNELAGSFGDIGTDLPLIIGIVLAAGLDASSVFLVFGALQILTGLLYRMPMPVQPLKAMAVIVITQQLSGDVLYGAGIAVGLTMLLLTVSGALGLLVRWIPLCVVRGIQLGLGLSLASLALKNYVPSLGWHGYGLAAAALLAMLALWGNRRVPPGLLIMGIGLLSAVASGWSLDTTVAVGFAPRLPEFHAPGLQDILAGFLLLALPQIPLSLSNAIIATERTVRDLFPGRGITVRQIGLTYSAMNIAAPFLGGIPVCHGCGGLAGHYAFGARTGGSVIIYGTLYLALGLFLSGPLHEVLKLFPLPILGVMLFFEALTLVGLVRDQANRARDMTIALFVGLIAFTLAQGFLVALLLGTFAYYGFRRFGKPHDERAAG